MNRRFVSDPQIHSIHKFNEWLNQMDEWDRAAWEDLSADKNVGEQMNVKWKVGVDRCRKSN